MYYVGYQDGTTIDMNMSILICGDVRRNMSAIMCQQQMIQSKDWPLSNKTKDFCYCTGTEHHQQMPFQPILIMLYVLEPNMQLPKEEMGEYTS